MAKLRYVSANDSILRNFEWEGEPQELLAIYDGLKKRLGNSLQIDNTIPHKYDPQPKSVSGHLSFRSVVPQDYSEISKKMPTLDQLTEYILTKQKFEHDIIDVGLKFFNKPIRSRQYGRLYRELRAKLENARRSIEASQHGAFERRSARPRNLQVYTFRPVNATPLGLQPEKHPSP